MNENEKKNRIRQLSELTHINLALLRDLDAVTWLEVVSRQVNQLARGAMLIYQYSHPGTSEAEVIDHFSTLAADCNQYLVAHALTHGEAVGLLSMCLQRCLDEEVEQMRQPDPAPGTFPGTPGSAVN